MKRILYLCLGGVATMLAFVGLVTPIVPALPFLLVALWAFAQSSPRLHQWLKTTPLVSAALKDITIFQQHRSIARRVKIISQIGAWASLLVMFLFLQNIVVIIIAFISAISCSIIMYILPTTKE